MTGDVSHADNRLRRYPQGRSDSPGRTGDPEPRGGQDVSAVDLCRLTVLAHSVQVDLALPTDVPVSVLIPGIVGLLAARGHGRSTPTEPHGSSWTLSRMGEAPLDGTSTLGEAAIHDGELLVLGSARAPAPPPLFDDLMYAVATAGSAPGKLWSARTAQLVGFGVAAVAVALACLALLLPPLAAAESNAAALDTGIGAATAALLFVTAGSIIGRVYGDDRTGVFMSGCALPLVFTSGVLFVPGALGAPHLLLGASATGAVAILALRLGGHGAALFTGTATAAAIALTAAAVVAFTDLPTTTVGAGTTIMALAGLAVAPRMSMMQARLPLPPVPTAGASLDEELDDDRPSADRLEILAGRARSYLTGLVCAACAAAAVGALIAALGSDETGGTYWPGISLAALTAVVLILRGRTFAEAQHAVPLVAAGSVIVLSLLAAVAFASATQPLTVFVVALVVVVATLVFGSFVPTRVYSPVLRRAAELVDYAAIAAVVPIACWVCGLYTAMRGL